MNHDPRDELLRLSTAAAPRGFLLCPNAFHMGLFVARHEHFVHQVMTRQAVSNVRRTV